MKSARISDLLRLLRGCSSTRHRWIPARTPGAPGDKAKTTSKFEVLGGGCPISRNVSTRRDAPASGAAFSSSCRAWTPPGRAAPSSTRWVRRPAGRVDQGVRTTDARESSLTTSSGVSAQRCRGPASSASSIDRSYEDVLIVRVHDLVPRSTWSRRYATINRFEDRLMRTGVHVVKVFLHISLEEQRERLPGPCRRCDEALEVQSARSRRAPALARLPRGVSSSPRALQHRSGTVVRRSLLTASGTATGPISQLLVEQLEDMDPQWPAADFDVDAARTRLLTEQIG